MQPVYYKKKFGDGWQKLMKKHIQLAGQLAMKAKIVGKRPEVRIQGCIPPCCESLRPDLCKEYLDDEVITILLISFVDFQFLLFFFASKI